MNISHFYHTTGNIDNIKCVTVVIILVAGDFWKGNRKIWFFVIYALLLFHCRYLFSDIPSKGDIQNAEVSLSNLSPGTLD